MNHLLGNNQSGYKRVLLHILFWVSYISFFILQYAVVSENLNVLRTAAGLSLTAIIDIGASYFSVYILLQKFLLRQKYAGFVILSIVSVAIFIIAQRSMLYYVNFPLFYPDSPSRMRGFWEFNPFYTFINIYSVVALFAAIKLIKNWFMVQKQKAELESKNKSSEMALLRSQLNPHFLFNTLNNIDSLIFSNQQKASDAIIKLSDILRSVIYENEEMVSLQKEVEYIKNYIDLQSLRLKNKDFVEFEHDQACLRKKIAPMLLLPFVENAFKHGFKNTPSPGIVIRLACSNSAITFEIVNKVNMHIDINKDGTPGVGLKNTRRRLELIYGSDYKLDFDSNDQEFRVRLALKNQ